MSVHACFQGGLAVFVEGVGGNGDDRDLCDGFVFQRANLSGGGVAVHNWHLDVHEDDIIKAFRVIGDFFYGNGSVFSSIYFEASLFQNGSGDFTVHAVVLHKKDSFAGKKFRRTGNCLLFF